MSSARASNPGLPAQSGNHDRTGNGNLWFTSRWHHRTAIGANNHPPAALTGRGPVLVSGGRQVSAPL